MKASLVVTSYNYGLYIERCLRSCFSQNFNQSNYEVVVVDDASTDNTLVIIEKFKKFPNFRIIRNIENVGVAESSNRGIRESLAPFVVRIDADDYINSNFLLFLSEYLEANNGLLGVGCDYIKVNNSEEVLGRFYASEAPISCGVMYRKDLLVEAGLYNSDFRHCEEKELRARLGEQYRIDYLKIPLYRYRMHGNNKTKQIDEVKVFEERIRTMHIKNGNGNNEQ